jgi:hypothetical protein
VLKSSRARAVATVFLGVALLSACSTTRSLNTTDVQNAISLGLTEQIGGKYTVSCPSDIEAKTGGTFVCDVTDDTTGQKAKVTGTQDDDQGHFTWSVDGGSSASPAPSAAPSAS